MVVHTYNPSRQEAEAEDHKFKVSLGYSEFETSLGSIVLCSKTRKEKESMITWISLIFISPHLISYVLQLPTLKVSQDNAINLMFSNRYFCRS
jgi:hypothetical protein